MILVYALDYYIITQSLFVFQRYPQAVYHHPQPRIQHRLPDHQGLIDNHSHILYMSYLHHIRKFGESKEPIVIPSITTQPHSQTCQTARGLYTLVLSTHTDLLQISHPVKKQKQAQHNDQKRFHISMISQSYPQAISFLDNGCLQIFELP